MIYTEISEKFDIATVNQLYNSVKEAVNRRDFKFDVFINDTAYVRIYLITKQNVHFLAIFYLINSFDQFV